MKTQTEFIFLILFLVASVMNAQEIEKSEKSSTDSLYALKLNYPIHDLDKFEKASSNFNEHNKIKIRTLRIIGHLLSDVSLMKDGEIYEVEMTSKGCFHYRNESIRIMRIDGQFFLESNLSAPMELTNLKMNSVKEFQLKLLEVRESYSTTQNSYVIRYQNNQSEIIGDHPNENIWRELIKKLYNSELVSSDSE